jgi:hypothetical protein
VKFQPRSGGREHLKLTRADPLEKLVALIRALYERGGAGARAPTDLLLLCALCDARVDFVTQAPPILSGSVQPAEPATSVATAARASTVHSSRPQSGEDEQMVVDDITTPRARLC